MRRTGIVWDERYLLHDTGPGHPERSDRLRAIFEALEGLSDKFTKFPGRPAETEWIGRIHSSEYVERVRLACEQGCGWVDVRETTVSRESYEVARLAVGGCLAVVDAVARGELDNGFCPVRPPGHHAEHDRAMGFCLFNNTAIAAEYLRRECGMRRILILDWDVHHGNGTQHTFEADPDVFFCSLHEDPRYLFPGTGWAHETGVGPGLGTTLNIPFLPHAGDEDMKAAYEQAFVPAAREFEPDFMLASVGFDAHIDDPLATLDFTEAGFDWLIQRTLALADELCEGRLVTILEGGYNLNVLAACTRRHVERLLGLPVSASESSSGSGITMTELRRAAARADRDVLFWW